MKTATEKIWQVEKFKIKQTTHLNGMNEELKTFILIIWPEEGGNCVGLECLAALPKET